MKFSFAFIFIFGLFLPVLLRAAMSGGDFEIYADSVGFLDSSGSTGGDFTLFDSGESAGGATSTGGTYELRGGFQAQEKGVLSLSVTDATIDFGTLSVSSVTTDSTSVSVTTDSETGYALYISDDGNLRSGANDINDVSDAAITAGSEEYGFVTSGDDALVATATAITVSPTLIASGSGDVSVRQTAVEFQAAISASTANANYSHSVLFSVTVNP